jgi:hypothetical protein
MCKTKLFPVIKFRQNTLRVLLLCHFSITKLFPKLYIYIYKPVLPTIFKKHIVSPPKMTSPVGEHINKPKLEGP